MIHELLKMNLNVSFFLINLLLIAFLIYVQSAKSGFVNSPKSDVDHRLRPSVSKFASLKEKNKSPSNSSSNLSTTATSLFGKSLSGLRPVVNEWKSRLSSKFIRSIKPETTSFNVNQIKTSSSEPKMLKFNPSFDLFKTSLLANHSKIRLRHRDIRPVSSPSYKSKRTVLSPFEKSRNKRPTKSYSRYAKSASENHEVDDMMRRPKQRPYRSLTKYNTPSEDYEDQDYQDDVKYSQRDTRYDDDQEQHEQSPDYEEPSDEYTQSHKKQPPNRASFLKDFEESEEDNFGGPHEPKKMRELEQGVEYGVEALAEKQAERQIEQAIPGGVPYESYEQGSDGYADNENDNDSYSQHYISDYDNEDNYAARQKASFNNFFAPEPRPNSNQYWNSPMMGMGEGEMEYSPNVKW